MSLQLIYNSKKKLILNGFLLKFWFINDLEKCNVFHQKGFNPEKEFFDLNFN